MYLAIFRRMISAIGETGKPADLWMEAISDRAQDGIVL